MDITALFDRESVTTGLNQIIPKNPALYSIHKIGGPGSPVSGKGKHRYKIFITQEANDNSISTWNKFPVTKGNTT